ncbi:odorant receptor 194 isoform X1 [Nasonia vitripennis]|uniref:Odorant receptor n=1 Tax=Nasonia vitripennis TaxID=7425 RepID=A0A7M7PVC1_NASVI|nr:odorant receptor 194 isoform X1 [Nasonia vitripennis]
MDIINGPDFVYSRICLRPFGLWPFQDPKSKLISRVITLMAVSTVLIPHIMKTYEFRNDFHILLMCIPSLLYYAHYITKFLYIAFREEKFRNVLERIKDDFVTFRGESLNHLTNYSEEARKFNTFYMMYLCSTVVIYNVTAFIPHMLDFVFPLENATRPRHAARLVKYNIHQIDNNFYFVLIHGMIFDVVAIAIIIGFDALFINCAQHACALFKIVVVELRKSTKLDEKMSNSASDLVTLQCRQDIFYAKLVRTIIAHKHAIEFTDNLESTYALVNFLMIGIAVATITLTEFETIVHVNEVDIMCRFAFFSGGELISMLYQNWPGQRIKDHSLRVHASCFECEWYREDVSYKSKRLLMFMMLKSEVPSALTAGKLFILDLQNYVKIFKASLSYFAFLSSVAKVSSN